MSSALPARNDLGHAWQDRVAARAKRLLAMHRAHTHPYLARFCGMNLLMHPEVFCPAYGEGSELIAASLQVGTHHRVLDMGTGSGGLGALAAIQGASVLATDISPIAVNCAEMNVERLGLADKMEVRVGDLWDAVPRGQQFSLILFNPPFLDGTPGNWLERAIFDERHQTLRRFIQSAHEFLVADGRVLLAFSSAGDIAYLKNLLSRARLVANVIRSSRGEFDFFVYELVNLQPTK